MISPDRRWCLLEEPPTAHSAFGVGRRVEDEAVSEWVGDGQVLAPGLLVKADPQRIERTRKSILQRSPRRRAIIAA